MFVPQFRRSYVSVLVAVENAEQLYDLLVSLYAGNFLLHEREELLKVHRAAEVVVHLLHVVFGR